MKYRTVLKDEYQAFPEKYPDMKRSPIENLLGITNGEESLFLVYDNDWVSEFENKEDLLLHLNKYYRYKEQPFI